MLLATDCTAQNDSPFAVYTTATYKRVFKKTYHHIQRRGRFCSFLITRNFGISSLTFPQLTGPQSCDVALFVSTEF
jgi:hypothetical protein